MLVENKKLAKYILCTKQKTKEIYTHTEARHNRQLYSGGRKTYNGSLSSGSSFAPTKEGRFKCKSDSASTRGIIAKLLSSQTSTP